MLELILNNQLWLFFLIVFGVVILPGMDMAIVMSSAMSDGRRAGWFAVFGIMLGGAAHVVMGVLGFGLMIKMFPAAFNLMLLAGSIYIVWIGVSLLRGATALGEIKPDAEKSMHHHFIRGTLTSLLNPKAYLFMLAIFPQFIQWDRGRIWLQASVLGLIIASIQIFVYGGIAIAAGRIRIWLQKNRTAQIKLGQSIGVLLIVAAIWTGWKSWL